MLEKADVWLSAWGARNTRAFSNIDSEKIKKLIDKLVSLQV